MDPHTCTAQINTLTFATTFIFIYNRQAEHKVSLLNYHEQKKKKLTVLGLQQKLQPLDGYFFW
jgi:hypothetical protein